MATRPSKVYDVHPKWVAWCFDRAVEAFGRWVESEVQDAARDSKNEKAAQAAADRVLQRILDSANPDQPSVGRFADPMSRMSRA